MKAEVREGLQLGLVIEEKPSLGDLRGPIHEKRGKGRDHDLKEVGQEGAENH